MIYFIIKMYKNMVLIIMTLLLDKIFFTIKIKIASVLNMLFLILDLIVYVYIRRATF